MPSGSEWAYEIKHDGFRFLAVRQRKQVRIYSRGGHDWAERLPAITEAMRALPVRSVVLDGEGVICGPMAALISTACARASAATALQRPSSTRSTCWSSTAAICADEPWAPTGVPCWCSSWPTSHAGVRLCEHIEDVDGAVVFRQACVMGLEGIVAKRRDSRYRSGRSRDWIKIKNMAHPAIERAMLIALSKRMAARRK